MIATVVLGLAIAIYAGWVMRKKYKDWKAGKYCGCGSCTCKSKCRK